MKKIYSKLKMLLPLFFTILFFNRAEAQTTVNFNSATDLGTYFNSTQNKFINITGSGLAGTGCVNVDLKTDLCTYKTGFSGFEVGSTYIVSAYFYNFIDGGFGGLGFTNANSNTPDEYGSPLHGIGIATHGGGAFFINNKVLTATPGWVDLELGKWYKMILKVTALGSNTFDLNFQIWNSDGAGNLGTMYIESTQTGTVNAEVGSAGTLYVYFSCAVWRFSYLDNFSFTLLAPQTITFDALSAKTYGDAPYTLSATGGASGNPVIFSSSDPAIATCTGINGTTLSILKAGSVSINANQAGNDSYAAALQVSQTLTINPKELTITGASATNKVYDGGLTAAITGGLLVGVVGSDVVTLATATSGTFDTATVGTGKTVTSAMTLTGTSSGNYDITQPVLTAEITARELTVTGALAANKAYDGNTDAVISGAILEGVVGVDDVTLATATTGIFASANAGTAIVVTPAMTITGAATGNYTLTQPTLTADITAKELTVTGAVAANKVYDGTADAVISGATLAGVVGSDNVTLATATTGIFASANTGTAIEVTPAMIISGAATSNYTLTQPTLTADITAKELTVTGAAAANKVYDGNTDAVISGATLNGLVGSDDVTLANATTGIFASASSGRNISVATAMTLTGAASGNYTLAQPILTADIIGTLLTVSNAMAANKVYDATTDAVISGGTLNGILGSDVVTLATATAGTFTSANVGTGISVTSNMTLAGANAGKYMLEQPALTADITAKELSVTADDKSRMYGDLNPVFTLTYSGFSGTDDAAAINVLPTASCTANTSSAAGNYDIVLAGGSDNNYSLVLHNGRLTVTAATTISEGKALEISVYPNPAGDYLYIKNLPEKTTVRIFNLQGTLVKNSISSIGTEKIDAIDLLPGVYIIKLSGNEIETDIRFTKK